jgi:hypothetical protein
VSQLCLSPFRTCEPVCVAVCLLACQGPLALFQFRDRHFDQVHLGCGEPFPGLLRPKVEGVPGAKAKLPDERIDATQIPRIPVGAQLGDEMV